MNEYTYLGVCIDQSGSMQPHLEKMKKRSDYLRASIRYYSHHLTFENQYLLWAVYVRPYFMYAAPALHTQNKTVQDKLHSMWRNSFKQFMGLPKCMSAN